MPSTNIAPNLCCYRYTQPSYLSEVIYPYRSSLVCVHLKGCLCEGSSEVRRGSVWWAKVLNLKVTIANALSANMWCLRLGTREELFHIPVDTICLIWSLLVALEMTVVAYPSSIGWVALYKSKMKISYIQHSCVRILILTALTVLFVMWIEYIVCLLVIVCQRFPDVVLNSPKYEVYTQRTLFWYCRAHNAILQEMNIRVLL